MWRVVEVIDGDTFDVRPSWKWQGQEGNRVRPTGYDAPEIGTSGWLAIVAREKLKRLILGRDVKIRMAYKVDRGRLVADVFVNDRNLASYFPEYQ